MRHTADAIVVGLGAMGAATVYELARRGATVIGIDGRSPPHEYGSSHGLSRIIREAYFEHPLYVPLVQRAYELWQELEELTGAWLYRRTGGLMAGPPSGTLIRGTLASVHAHHLPHEVLDAGAIRRRFPALLPEDDFVGVLEPRAGMLNPEACIRTFLELARGYGAELRTGSALTSWQVAPDGSVTVHTADGNTARASLLVVAAGPWLNAVLSAERASSPAHLPLTVERQVSHWIMPADATGRLCAEEYPVTLWEFTPGRFLYTLPDAGSGFKAGIHHEGVAVDPDRADRTVSTAEQMQMRELLEWLVPGLGRGTLRSSVCLYTNTPDGHFIVDSHPAHDQVLLVSACSGHGFKFASAIGEIVAEMALEGGSRFDLSPFRLDRPA